MYRCLIILFFIFFMSRLEVAQAQSTSRFVHVNSGKLVDTLGKPLHLKSVNAGGWLLWEGWIWGAGKGWIFNGFISQSQILQRLHQATDSSFANEFASSVKKTFVTESDCKTMNELGFNSIRVPLNFRDFLKGASIPTGWDILDSLVVWGRRNNLYIIPEMHSAPAAQMKYFVADPTNVSLWKGQDGKNATASLWKSIAARYKNEPVVVGYDLLGEPDPPQGKMLVEVYRQIIDSIRSSGSKQLIILQGSNYATDFSMFTSVLDSNQIFSFHYYPWFWGKQKQLKQLAYYHQTAEKLKVPMWCGEWGENTPEMLNTIMEQLRNPQYNFCGEAFWTWKKTPPNKYAALQKIRDIPDFQKLLENKKMSKQEAMRAAKDFLQACQFSECTLHPQLEHMFMECYGKSSIGSAVK